MINLLLLASATGVGGLLLGALIGTVIGGRSRQSEAMLLSFSAGAMIALVCFELLHEAIETGVGIVPVTAAVLAGAALVTFLDYIVDKRSGHSQDFIICEDCDEEFEHDEHHAHCSEHAEAEQKGLSACGSETAGLPGTAESGSAAYKTELHGSPQQQGDSQQQDTPEPHSVPEHHHKRASQLQLFVAGLVMAAAVAVHNVPEGMSVGTLYVSGGGIVSGALLMLLFSIVLHNIPEGMAISVPLMTGGMGRGRACAVAALSGMPTVLGALLGYALGDMGPLGLALSLSFAAGTLLYVVFGEVMPQAINLYCSRKTAFAAIAGAAAGMLILSSHMH